ncbi:FAD-dependent oxidoreductase [Paenibacillus athensensis]|nr:FAD-dependent oxidoreductase [Paenibacillus athensensis]MCD1261031.1 FAD-dependent oxidoreductase [Paenibacillus athensensis]
MKTSVCVIGAGIGGLMAGAYLAQAGYAVTILEKAATVGGSAGWYVRRNRRFPTGATLAFGLEAGGLLRSRLEELGVELEAEELEHPMDIVLPDRKVAVLRNAAAWEEELAQRFPEQRAATLRFWRELEAISHAVLGVTGTGAALPVRRPADLGGLPGYLLRHPRTALQLARSARRTVLDLLRAHGLEHYEPLVRLLNLQLVDAVQTDVSRAALLPSSLALTVYRQGSFGLDGGLGGLCEALASRIAGWGGEIVTASPVQSAVYNAKQRKWSVEAARRSGFYDIVVNNTGLDLEGGLAAGANPRAGTKAEPGRALPVELQPQPHAGAWGAFRLDAVLDETGFEACLPRLALPFAYQIAPDCQHDRLFGDEHGPVYVTFQRTLDGKGRPVIGEVTMTATVHTDTWRWLACSDEAYAAQKQQAGEALWREIAKIADLRRHVRSADIGTPRTYLRYIGKAEVGGFPLTVERALLRPAGVRTSVPGLYHAGETVFPGPGTLSAALSGMYAARAIGRDYR